ncbi:MAG: OsmC family peroxiredoxin [Crocinitomicaceae bacterium]|jgi:organic hydroperoxide reductase OsmC/OhrA|nr:OsmC family peroxiredoxin [Crocinitomicaceae bacterium]
MKLHHYTLQITWTGNTGTGTSGYRNYERSHTIQAENKVTLEASSDPAFRGDASKYNPEELLLASLSSCHMLWFLHLCADKGIIVTAYEDRPTGILDEGSGRFTEATLNPIATINDPARLAELEGIHHEAHKLCFIANSVNFPVKHVAKAQSA